MLQMGKYCTEQLDENEREENKKYCAKRKRVSNEL